MIARDLDDGSTLLIKQDDHADLAAMFAARWGNAAFATSDRHDSVVRAAIYHDAHYKEMEAVLAIDRERGRPYGHRNLPFSPTQFDAIERNIAWLGGWDADAATLVSMHHTGLPQNRYGVIRSWQNGQGKAPPARTLRPEMADWIARTERARDSASGKPGGGAKAQTSFDYRLMQVFDLLSLYCCCDGYDGPAMKDAWLGPVPLAPGSNEETNIHIQPIGGDTIRVDPYPFDTDRFPISVVTRTVRQLVGHSDEECRKAYERAPRESLSWTITR